MRRPTVPLSATILWLLLLSLLSVTTSAGGTATVETLFTKGNEAYSRGDYDEAVNNYLTIIDNAGYAPGVLFNLANSYAQKGEIGQAVLNYERALRLSPGDADIGGNLQHLREQHGLFPGEPSTTKRVFSFLNLQQWALLALGGLLFFTLLRFALLRFPLSRPLVVALSLLSLMSIGGGIAGAGYQYRHYNPAVVIARDARLLLSPFPDASPVGSILEGRLVEGWKHHNGFIHVTDATGRTGWLPEDQVEFVITEQQGLHR